MSILPSPSGGEFADGFGEDLGVQVHVGFGGGRAHQCHVVKGRKQDAAVEGVEVEEALELEIAGGRGLAAVARSGIAEGVFGAAAELLDVPGEAGGGRRSPWRRRR